MRRAIRLAADALLACRLLAPPGPGAAVAGCIALSVGSAVVSAGQTATLGITAAAVDYDPSVAIVTSAQGGPGFPQPSANLGGAAQGTVLLAAASAQGAQGSAPVLAVLTLRGVGATAAATAVSVENASLADAGLGAPQACPQDGSLSVTAGPLVTALSPATGPAAGGTAVTVSGGGFTGAAAVRFGARAASSFAVQGDGTISAVAPPGSGTVAVTAAGATSADGPGDRCTYAAPAAQTLAVAAWRPSAPVGQTVQVTAVLQDGARPIAAVDAPTAHRPTVLGFDRQPAQA